MKNDYAVKHLARLAGVSVRTLHLYDKIGLLKPSLRTGAGYRRYGQDELLRLQQILFYRELDFPLKQIQLILDDPQFDLLEALEGHKVALTVQRDRLNTLMNTINKTIDHLKNETMNNFEELYEGLPKDEARQWRNQAIAKWGEDTVLRSERALLEMPELNLEQLKADQKDIFEKLRKLSHENPESKPVQKQIGRHYANIRSFWGVSDPTDLKASTYKGLAELYLTDDRYTAQDGLPDLGFGAFMHQAMIYFADSLLKADCN